MQEKAYKLLSRQENISHNAAKELIDSGLVSVNGVKVSIARTLLDSKTKFTLIKPKKAQIIFEDERLIAVNKPFGLLCQTLEKHFKARLLNRLDKETSGVILLCKDENFRKICIDEFRAKRVFKSYFAILSGVLGEEVTINEPILSIKTSRGAFGKVSKDGALAQTTLVPLRVCGKKTLVKALIPTGRTHQIRIHAAFIKHGIIGDEKYAKIPAKRMFLHSFEIKILNYHFKADLDESFCEFGFDIAGL